MSAARLWWSRTLVSVAGMDPAAAAARRRGDTLRE